MEKPVEEKSSHLDGLFWKAENAGWVLMIKGYFDETFDDYSGCAWVAGCIGNESAWSRYVLDWKSGLGNRKQLHLSSLRWKNPYTQKLLTKLAPIPFQCGLQGIASGVKTADFIDLVKGTHWEHRSNGYIVALASVAVKAILSVPDGEHLEIVFDKRDQTAERAEGALFAMRVMAHMAESDNRMLNTDGSQKLSKYGFQLTENTTLFDPADYICYALLQKHRGMDSKKMAWTRPVLESGRIIDPMIDRDTVRDIFSGLLVSTPKTRK